MKRILFLLLLAVTAFTACTFELLPETPSDPSEETRPDDPLVPDVPVITATLPEGATIGTTKVDFDFQYPVLSASWHAGDQISVVPDGYNYPKAGLYTLPQGGGHTGDFVRTTAVGATASSYTVFFPGDKIKSESQYTRLFFTGQTQDKNAPLAHLSDYFSMRKVVTSYSTIDFSDADVSACMYLDLSGKTFKNPSNVEVKLLGANTFIYNNYPSDQFSYYTSEPPASVAKSNSFSLDLVNYASESSLKLWIAMPALSVTIPSGTIVRVNVTCADGVYCSDLTVNSDIDFESGHCHRIYIDSGWKANTADYTQYSFNGEVVRLAEPRLGLDLVVMGDGFIAEDFAGGDNSTYMTTMRAIVEDFFSIPPYDYLRQFFDVYIVKAVSPERTNAETTGLNGARNLGSETVFNVRFAPNATTISGYDDAALAYASLALGDNEDRLADATVIVVANQPCRSGTCYNFWDSSASERDYGRATSISYFGLGTHEGERTELVRHESGGHGFGKLADEYTAGKEISNTGPWNTLENQHAIGLFRNVDRYVTQSIADQLGYPVTTTSNVLWHDLFGTANNYELATVENLGIYEGANTYDHFFCRPTSDPRNSIMNYNTGIFNAISRRQIMYRAKSLMEEAEGAFGSAAELASFLAWDAEYFLPHISEYISPATMKAATAGEGVLQYRQPLAAPVNRFGHWEGCRFIKEAE